MTSIILFRFHSNWELCWERLRLIRWLNPGTPVHGLYGGEPEAYAAARRALSPLLDSVWSLAGRSNRWKWLHQDFAVREWFDSYGYAVQFDCLFDYEYDLLLTRRMDAIVPAVSGRVVALSGLKKLADVRPRWYWTAVQPFASSFEQYARFMHRQFGLTLQTYVSQGPFPVLSRTFLEASVGFRYSDAIFAHINCETSYPGLAEALGFQIIDTGLHPGWTAAIPSISASDVFHCESEPRVSLWQISSELRKPAGRRAFHPVKEAIPHDVILSLIDEADIRGIHGTDK